MDKMRCIPPELSLPTFEIVEPTTSLISLPITVPEPQFGVETLDEVDTGNSAGAVCLCWRLWVVYLSEIDTGNWASTFLGWKKLSLPTFELVESLIRDLRQEGKFLILRQIQAFHFSRQIFKPHWHKRCRGQCKLYIIASDRRSSLSFSRNTSLDIVAVQ